MTSSNPMQNLPRIIQSRKRGEKMIFIKTAEDTNGKMLEFRHVIQPHSGYSPAHLHAEQTETYEVIKGIATYQINGEVKKVHRGEPVIIPPDTMHVNPYNESDDILIIHRTTTPEGGAQLFFVTWFALVEAGEHINDHLELNLLQLARVAQFLPKKTFVKGYPRLAQKIGLAVFAFIARLINYRLRYENYEQLYFSDLEAESDEIAHHND